MEDHHVEQQVLGLDDGAISRRAVGVDRLAEVQRVSDEILPGPVGRAFGSIALPRCFWLISAYFALAASSAINASIRSWRK